MLFIGIAVLGGKQTYYLSFRKGVVAVRKGITGDHISKCTPNEQIT